MFMIYQVTLITLYTLGNIPKEKVMLYKLVDDLIVQVFPRYSVTETVHEANILALGEFQSSNTSAVEYKTTSGYELVDSFSGIMDDFNNYDLVIASYNENVKTSSYDEFNDEAMKLLKDFNVSVVATSQLEYAKKTEKDLDDIEELLKTSEFDIHGINDALPIVKEVQSIKIGIISYTYEEDEDDYNENVRYLTDENLNEDIKFLNEKDVDTILVYLDIDNEDSVRVSNTQKEVAEKLFTSGVNIVIQTGSSYVKETYEDIYVKSDSTENHGYVVYSSGNIVSSEIEDYNVFIAANITIEKTISTDNKGILVDEKVVMKINNPNIYYTDLEETEEKTYNLNKVVGDYENGTLDLDKNVYQTMSELLNEYKNDLNYKE